MSWGYKILFVIIGFIVFILTLVVIAMKQNNEVFDKNYYEKELKYQNKINAHTNLINSNEKINIEQNPDALIIYYPMILWQDSKDGYLELLRPNDNTKDITLNTISNKNGAVIVPRKSLFSGIYLLRTGWQQHGTDYYFENTIYIK